jgi:exopolysaccharide biosynthesis polyprenyl glycosylphosphotransferase
MLRQRARALAGALIFTDLLITVLSLVLAYALRNGVMRRLWPAEFFGPLYSFSRYLALLILIVPIWTAALVSAGFYRSRRTLPYWEELWSAAKAVFLGTATLALAVYALKITFVSRPFLFLFALIDFLFLASEKLIIRSVAQKARARGYNFRTVVLAGMAPKALSLGRFLEKHPHWGFRVLGFLDDGSGGEMGTETGFPKLGNLSDLEAVLAENVVDEVIFVIERGRLEEFEEAMLAAERHGVRSHVALDLFPHVIARPVLEELDGVPLLTFTTVPSNSLLMGAKRAIDILFGSMLLLITLPVQLLAAVAVKLNSPGRMFFRQTRCGLNGRQFTLLKFRTMVDGAQELLSEITHLNEMSGPAFKATNDPRLTAVGKLLRRFSIDELPQLWNVLAGDMSLVGPRPPIPEEVARYEPWQRRRLSMKPGLTCLWQISGRNEIPDFDRWMSLDLKYIDTWTPWLDLKILALTVPAVLAGRGAR